MPASPPRIAVIGGGPAGLTFARVLQRRGLPVTVHERDRDPAHRAQGGSLDLHRDTGQVALTAAGLLDEFFAASRPEGQALRLLDRAGTVLVDAPADPDDRFKPEIDRGELRALLLGSLEPGTVEWDRRLRTAVPLGDGRHRLEFTDGHTTTCDLLVGADGARSAVRPLLSDAEPEHSGVVFVEVVLTDVDRAHPEIAELIGHGMTFALDAGRGLLAQRGSGGVIRVHAAFRGPVDWGHRVERGALRAVLAEMFADFGPVLRDVLHRCEDSFTVRPITALPVGHRWEHRPGVTLLGDAAHLMSPFSGQGANLAMLDAAELAELIAAGGPLDEAVTAYEARMFPRAAEAAAEAAGGVEDCIGPDGPAHALVHFQAMTAGNPQHA
ncbi:NAD(P)/FAD-dependent oxidoreductase [Saccharopolyspora sp. NPDC047091]|uniref:FAD-dependent oxidoreductase n=1 Tax=Saccharopolyspora sp. NPDC047091 TaxID=3155924 RepID=UPI0033F87295